MLFFVLTLLSCSKGKIELAAHALGLDTAYSMRTYDVNTLVSDSGLIQYRLLTKEWRIYTSGEKPRWYFPEGIYLEQFDEDLKTKATVKADTARYFTSQELWELVGNVHIRNLSGEQFYAPRMYWDRKTGRVFSPDSVYILTPEQELRGHSFDAIQDMSQYTFINPSGTIDYREESASPPSASISTESNGRRNTESRVPTSTAKKVEATPTIFSSASLSSDRRK